MKSVFIYIVWRYTAAIFVCLMFFSMTAWGQDADTYFKRRSQFQEIASKLDFGGEFLMVLNTDKLLDRVIDSALSDNAGEPADSPA